MGGRGGGGGRAKDASVGRSRSEVGLNEEGMEVNSIGEVHENEDVNRGRGRGEEGARRGEEGAGSDDEGDGGERDGTKHQHGSRRRNEIEKGKCKRKVDLCGSEDRGNGVGEGRSRSRGRGRGRGEILSPTAWLRMLWQTHAMYEPRFFFHFLYPLFCLLPLLC